MRHAAPIIIWFRNDLRLDDHEPLHRAVASGAPVVPVYCLDPRTLGTSPSGMARMGPFRTRFLLESLAALRTACRDRGGELIVRQGRPEDEIPDIARAVGAGQVFVHAEVASEELAVERRVAAVLTTIGARLERWWGHTLFHRDDLPFDISALPDLFTAFRNRVERDATVRPPFDAPARLVCPALAPGDIPALQTLSAAPLPRDERVRFAPSGGEQAAQARLAHYLWDADRLRSYKETRNGLLHVDDSSKLSPWLATGCLSPRRVWTEVQRYERERVRNDSTYWLVFELLWRDYFRFVAARAGDALFAIDGLQRLSLDWRSLDDGEARGDFDRWTNGTTGFPLVDASMRELALSGFLSNRARQNVASFLTKNLRIDWRAGAQWFEGLLVDYDVSSNWGNWAYAAGVGNDARGFRFFNLHKQAATYDAGGDFVRHWIPELRGVPGDAVHRPERLSTDEQQRFGVVIGRDYPAPMVDLFASARANEALYRKASRVAEGRRQAECR